MGQVSEIRTVNNERKGETREGEIKECTKGAKQSTCIGNFMTPLIMISSLHKPFVIEIWDLVVKVNPL